jgi:hypothetical protein
MLCIHSSIFTFAATTALLPAYVFSFDSTLDKMDVQKKALTLTLLHRRKHHQYWVLPLLCTGLEMGQFYIPFYEFGKDESEFFYYFRMSVKSSDKLINLLFNGYQD